MGRGSNPKARNRKPARLKITVITVYRFCPTTLSLVGHCTLTWSTSCWVWRPTAPRRLPPLPSLYVPHYSAIHSTCQCLTSSPVTVSQCKRALRTGARLAEPYFSIGYPLRGLRFPITEALSVKPGAYDFRHERQRRFPRRYRDLSRSRLSPYVRFVCASHHISSVAASSHSQGPFGRKIKWHVRWAPHIRGFRALE